MKHSQQTSTQQHGQAGRGELPTPMRVPVWLTGSWSHSILGYVGAILLSGIVVAITFLLVHFFPTFSYPGSLSILGILAIALLWGAGPSLLATLLIALLLDAVILPPQFALSLQTAQQAIDTGVFVLVGLTMSVVASRIEGARAEAVRARERLHDLFMQAPANIAILHGPDLRFELANPSYLQTAHRSAVLGKTVREVFPEAEQEPFMQMLEQVYATGTPFMGTEVWAQMRAQGNGTLTEGFFNFVCQPTRAPNGQMDGVMIHGIEVTEQVRARQRIEELVKQLEAEKEALQQSQQEAAARAEQLEAVFEAMAEGMSLYDGSGQLLRMNQAAREFLRLAAHPDYPSLPREQRASWLSLRDEQGRVLPKDQWPLTRVLQGEVLKGRQALDVRVSDRSGHEFQFSISGAPIRNQHGCIWGAALLSHDVTERRRLERRTHEALEALLAMAEVLVQVPAPGGSSAGETTGEAQQMASRLAALTHHMLDCERVAVVQVEQESGQLHPLSGAGYLPDEEQRWFTRMARLHLSDYLAPGVLARLSAGEVVLTELPEFAAQDTAQRTRSVLVAPVGIDPHLLGLLLLDCGDSKPTYTGEDHELAKAVARLTALMLEREGLLRERAQAHASALAALEARRHMDTFLGIASHELRTPLTIIKGNLQLATWSAEQLISEQDVQASKTESAMDPLPVLLAHAEQQVNRLSRLVNDLIEVSRSQTETVALHMQVCDLSDIVREAVEDQRLVTPTRTIHLDLDPSQEGLVYADADRIGQVVTNYLTNALKYSPGDQPVEVRLEQEEQVVRVLVHDRGPGLTPAQQAWAWERFHRVEGMKVQAGSSEGLGLGLYISRMIIERHGGQVGVDSHPGEGSTFWFTLLRLQIEEETTGDHNPYLE
jgi:K+-sensing histidine kinase KdpD